MDENSHLHRNKNEEKRTNRKKGLKNSLLKSFCNLWQPITVKLISR